jgi:Holliday junction resolvase-like predicted endonuclease
MHASTPINRLVAVSLTLTGLLAVATGTRADEISTLAISGRPLGVGRMTVKFQRSETLRRDVMIRLVEAKGRALYPAFETSQVRTAAGVATSTPSSVTAYFLFRGDEPLKLNLHSKISHRTTIRPSPDAQGHKKLLAEWWTRYAASAKVTARADNYPPIIENYLTRTLARRFDLKAPALQARFSGRKDIDTALAVMTGAESVKLAMQRKVLLADTDAAEKADQPLPRAVTTPAVRIPTSLDDVVIEPIANYVPLECFYLRTGSFNNFLWLKRTIDDWGTQVRHLTSVRGVDYQINRRLERQLGLKQTILARLFGNQAISDVAMFGTDTFLREGASIGILFEARSSTVLTAQINRLRSEAKKSTSGAKSRTIKIAEHDVSFLSTPDNKIRSFYAVSGKYHLVTTSRTLVRRFFESAAGKQSLGRSKEFRYARSLMPVSENHTVFVYLSDPFFRKMISPQYRIEMTRRMRAASEIDVVRLAQLAARAEGHEADSVKQLIATSFLPKGFGHRADGSQIVTGKSDVTDSLRGAYGSFLPVADVEIAKATPSEVAAYREFSNLYARQWRRMDPVTISIKHRAIEDNKERVTLKVHITPYAREHYGSLAAFMHTADKKSFAPIAGNIAWAQANMMGHTYFGGLRDFAPRYAIKHGEVLVQNPDEHEFPFYIGGRQRDARAGYFFADAAAADDLSKRRSTFFGKLWARRVGELDLLAWRKDIVAKVGPHLKMIDAERPAKARLRINDLRETKIAELLNAEGYIRGRQVSAGNVHLMHALVQQLHVPSADAKKTAERLLSANLLCPLGGKYESQQGFSDFDTWRSTAWKDDRISNETKVPKAFRAPLLDWFAGLSLEFDIDATTIRTHIEIDVRKGKK